MPFIEEEIERQHAYQAAARDLAREFRGRLDAQSIAQIVELIDANEAPIGLNHLAHASERLGSESMTELERQRLFDLVHGTEEVDALPPSFAGMTPSSEPLWLTRADPAT